MIAGISACQVNQSARRVAARNRAYHGRARQPGQTIYSRECPPPRRAQTRGGRLWGIKAILPEPTPDGTFVAVGHEC